MFTISVAEILGRPGRYRDVALVQPLDGIRTELARLTGAPISARLRLESVVEGVLVTGPAEAPATLRCARCLVDFDSEVQVGLCELFAVPGHVEEDSYRVDGTDVDLEPMLRDALVLGLPLNPLCRPECRGLCAGCGRNLNEGECDCTHDDADPRWAQLDEVRARLATN